MHVRSLAAALAVAGLVTSSCGGIVDPSKNVTDTFTGTVQPQGQGVHPFSTSKTGEFTVKVTSLTPSSSTFFGLILAQGPSDGSCSGNLPIVQQNSFSSVNTPALGGSILPGKYCVFIYDIGTFTTAQTYTLTVSHP